MTDPAVRTIAIIVPDWLQKSLAVLLDSLADFQLVETASSVDELMLRELSSGPDIVLLDAPKDVTRAREELARLKRQWPEAYYIALVSKTKDCAYLMAHGADRALIKGVPPDVLVEALNCYED
jgi:DNA-binding NarL/FixJ family response regulator